MSDFVAKGNLIYAMSARLSPHQASTKVRSSSLLQTHTNKSHDYRIITDNKFPDPQNPKGMRLRRRVDSEKLPLPIISQHAEDKSSKPDEPQHHSQSLFYRMDKNSKNAKSTNNLSILTHPSLDNICQEWWTRTAQAFYSKNNLNPIAKSPTFLTPVNAYKTHYSQEVPVTRHKLTTSIDNNVPQLRRVPLVLEEDAFNRSLQDKKYPVIQKVIGKQAHAPARVFTIVKNSGPRNQMINEGLEKLSTPRNRCGTESALNRKRKKITVLSMMKEKVLDLVNRSQSPPISKLGQQTVYSSQGFLNPLNIQTNLTVSKDIVVPIVNEPVTDRTLEAQNASGGMNAKTLANLFGMSTDRKGIINRDKKVKKKEHKIIRNFVSNAYMARIEREALKELRMRQKEQEAALKEKNQVKDEEANSSQKMAEMEANKEMNEDAESEHSEKEKKIEKNTVPLMVSIRRKLVKLLNKMKRLKINPKDFMNNSKIFSQTPYEKPGSKKLIEAARVGDPAVIEKIIDTYGRFIVHDFDHVHQTALHWAARKGFNHIVDLLVRKGADVDVKDLVGRTPLFFALKYNHIVVLRLLLANQADPWSTKDYDYKELASGNPTASYYLTRARQLHILMNMTPASRRDALWEREGARLLVGVNFNIDDN